MHTRQKQTTNHGVSFHNELQKQTSQNIGFQQFILLNFLMLQINCIYEKRVDYFKHYNPNNIRANRAQVFFD